MLLSGLLSALQTLAISHVLLFDSIPSPVFPGPLILQRHGKHALVSDCVLGIVHSQSACKRLLDGGAGLLIRLFNIKQPPVFTNKDAGTQRYLGSCSVLAGYPPPALLPQQATLMSAITLSAYFLLLRSLPHQPLCRLLPILSVSLSLWLLPFPDPHMLLSYWTVYISCSGIHKVTMQWAAAVTLVTKR